MKPRTHYPNRKIYFSIETGLLDAGANAARVENARLYRAWCYIYGTPDKLTVTTLEQFKEEFNYDKT